VDRGTTQRERERERERDKAIGPFGSVVTGPITGERETHTQKDEEWTQSDVWSTRSDDESTQRRHVSDTLVISLVDDIREPGNLPS